MLLRVSAIADAPEFRSEDFQHLPGREGSEHEPCYEEASHYGDPRASGEDGAKATTPRNTEPSCRLVDRKQSGPCPPGEVARGIGREVDGVGSEAVRDARPMISRAGGVRIPV